MKIRFPISLLLIAFGLASCIPPVAAPVTPTETELPTQRITLLSATPTPTLPPTLTPIPTSEQSQATPAAPYLPVELSPADNEIYQKALNDIPIYRQGELQVTVQDEQGKPLPGYIIRYRQTSHDFMFGGVADPFYASQLRQAGINTMTAYMDWRWLQPEYGKFDLDFANYWLGIDELKSAGMYVKTNNFFNTSDTDMAPYFLGVPYPEFLKRLHAHIATTVQRFGPSVDDWEAILEPNFGNHNPLNLTKDQYYEAISTSIAAIRENDPTATIEINLSYPCGGIDWLDNFQIVQEMLDRKIDFDVIGLQFYYNAYIAAGNYSMPEMSFSEMNACYDRYEKMLTPYGKRVVGSEFSVPSDAPAGQTGYWNAPWSEETQAQYLETAFTIFFSKPSNLGLVWWNTVEPSPHVYHGGLIGEDGTPKKSFYVLQNLIQRWITSGLGTADPAGNVTFKGFGGSYELEIIDPETGASMLTQAHLSEQKSTSQVVNFVPNRWLDEQKNQLEQLTGYWESVPDPVRAQKGQDYLALVNHHQQNMEWDLARQTLSTALDDLSIPTEIVIPVQKLTPVGNQGTGFTMEDGSFLIWGATTLHFPYAFPAGKVTLEIKAHSKSEKGEFPIMVLGVGANYSPVWKVENAQSQTYSYTFSIDGNERDLTIRFPYDGRINERITAQGGSVGELKLYIDQVKMIISSTEIPK
jgi:GH35 family endo-1,4-beta-xylanase